MMESEGCDAGVPATMFIGTPFGCRGCGLELPGNYPFTVCEDCWDRPRVTAACEFMARLMFLVWLEAMAEEEWPEWSDIPQVTIMDREIVVGRAVKIGAARLEWLR